MKAKSRIFWKHLKYYFGIGYDKDGVKMLEDVFDPETPIGRYNKEQADKQWKVNIITSTGDISRFARNGRYELSPDFCKRMFHGPYPGDFRTASEIEEILSESDRLYHHRSQILAAEGNSGVNYYIPLDVFHFREHSSFHESPYSDVYKVFLGTEGVCSGLLTKLEKYESQLEEELHARERLTWLTFKKESEHETMRKEIEEALAIFKKAREAELGGEFKTYLRNHGQFPMQMRRGCDTLTLDNALMGVDVVYKSNDSFEEAKEKVDKVGKTYIAQRHGIGSAFS
ncbi:MAG TPA: hypothetical protein HA282_03800 [Nanoarchaeota archaeon]|nr:hypothetical protein [Nanoarchaeota archaeon]HIH34734.1 hypothetical protein [Nanoarchaeota archaeon]HIH51337.1 hypothetical protein [Nanoarchaeota archaeon]HIH66314.1 hypothetical protein [Nanoarchaeota archaeon]